MHAWADVAVLVKAKNLKGRFVARAAAGLPFLLEEGDEVAFVPPQLDAPRRAIVSDVRLTGDYTAEISFEGVDAEAADALAGCHCLIARDSIDQSVYEQAPGAWEGWEVVDAEAGRIGVVSGFIDNPGQALLEVERPTGEFVLIPVVDAVITGVDVEGGCVSVALPKGLLEL